MLHGIGKNWTTDLIAQEKNGSFLYSDKEGLKVSNCGILPKYESISEIVDTLIYPKENVT